MTDDRPNLNSCGLLIGLLVWAISLLPILAVAVMAAITVFEN